MNASIKTPERPPKRARQGTPQSPLLFHTPTKEELREVYGDNYSSPSQSPASSQSPSLPAAQAQDEGGDDGDEWDTLEALEEWAAQAAAAAAAPASPGSSDDESSPEPTRDPLLEAVGALLNMGRQKGGGGGNKMPNFKAVTRVNASNNLIATFIEGVATVAGIDFSARVNTTTISKFKAMQRKTPEQVRDALLDSGAIVEDYSLLAGFADLAMARF